MRKFVLFLLLIATMPIIATNPFPKKGYKVKWIERTNYGFDNYSCAIKQFKDCDSIFYMVYTTPGMPPYSIRFSFLNADAAIQLVDILQSLRKTERIKWINGYLAYTNANQTGRNSRYNDYWTYFKPRASERSVTTNFTLANAIYAYQRDRDKDARWRNITPEQWLGLFQTAKVVLPLIGGEGDSRTLYDKIMQDGGY